MWMDMACGNQRSCANANRPARPAPSLSQIRMPPHTIHQITTSFFIQILELLRPCVYNGIRTRKIIYFFNSPFNSFHCCPIKLSQISGTAVELLKIKPIAWKNLITIGNSQEKAYWSVKTSWHKICRCPTTILVNILCFNGYMQIEPFIGIGSFKTI